jgi:SET domain-containing protein
VFASEHVPGGTLVWKFLPGLDLEINADQYNHAPPIVKEFLAMYSSEDEPGAWVLCTDNARFMNHSDDPNISASTDEGVALRDILAGEEITCNYREFDLRFNNPDSVQLFR